MTQQNSNYSQNSQSAFNTGNYHPNDYIPFQITGLNPLGQGSMFILPHVRDQLKSYFDHYGTNNYNGLLIKQRLEQLFPNAKGSRSLVNQKSSKKNARGTEIIDGVLICYTLNLKGRAGVFIDDLVWVGKDRREPQNGLYLVKSFEGEWIFDEKRSTEIVTDHLYIYEGSLRDTDAATMAGSVLSRTYHSDAITKFTLSYTEPTMLKKRGWYPAISIMRNRRADYQKSMGYLTSQIKRRSMSKVTDIVADGNGCIYLNDSLKCMSADNLAHLRVLLINPPFPITHFAARFDEAGLKYKNYGFVSSLGDYGSKIKGLGMNSIFGKYRMQDKYLEKNTDLAEQDFEDGKVVKPIIAAAIKTGVDLVTLSSFNVPVNALISVGFNLLTREYRKHDPLMTKDDVDGRVYGKMKGMMRDTFNKISPNNRTPE